MKSTTLPSTTQRLETATEIGLLRSRARWLAGMYVSSTFGLLSGIFGLGLTVLMAVHVFQNEAVINRAITVLLGTCFPLLFLAAHCLDKMRECETRVKREHCESLVGKQHS